ncbi:MAG TPA: alkaline phosphatase family protein [Vicinamibacterales bacterium]|nr:alkaline phosphatase family protein [Vicinamibacterales bacterium]
MHRISAVVLLLLLGACASAPERRDSAVRRPLVVLLVVDQLRSDYLDRYGAHLTSGIRRLADEGAWYRRAAYPFLNTVTCSGHATIGTGALPYRHGMVLNAWWDRETGRSRPCTSDPRVSNLAYDGTATGGDSAEAMLVAPLGQQLRERTGGRAVALSLKPRSAITMVGREPTAVVWFDDRAGWMTSTAFTPEPIAWLKEFFTRTPYSRDRGRVWDRLLPPSAYAGPDDAPGERAPTGWTTTFPHAVGAPVEQFNLQWQRSPYADEYLGRLAAHAVDTLDLGRGGGVDFLGVSFSTLDMVGHQYGPDSHEVQDVLIRLDRTIGTLLDHLDARLGRDGYVVGFSADHGVAPLPEQSGGRRLPSAEVIATINTALEPFFGPGRHVAHTVYTDLYFTGDVRERLKRSPAAAEAVTRALRGLEGIAHVFWSEELRSARARASTDPALRAAAISHYPPRSGDVVIVPRRHWLLSSAATTHGTLYAYDQNVPVIFFGRGVPAGRHDTAATPADIAPTLAALAGVRLPRHDGRPLVPAR